MPQSPTGLLGCRRGTRRAGWKVVGVVCRCRSCCSLAAGLALDAAARGGTGRAGGLDEVIGDAFAVADGIDLGAARIVERDAGAVGDAATAQGDVLVTEYE